MQQFGQIPSVNVPRYHHFPLGDGQSHFVKNTVLTFPEVFLNQKASPRLSPHSGISGRPGFTRHDSNMSTSSVSSLDSLYERPFEIDAGEMLDGYFWGSLHAAILTDSRKSLLLLVYFVISTNVAAKYLSLSTDVIAAILADLCKRFFGLDFFCHINQHGGHHLVASDI